MPPRVLGRTLRKHADAIAPRKPEIVSAYEKVERNVRVIRGLRVAARVLTIASAEPPDDARTEGNNKFNFSHGSSPSLSLSDSSSLPPALARARFTVIFCFFLPFLKNIFNGNTGRNSARDNKSRAARDEREKEEFLEVKVNGAEKNRYACVCIVYTICMCVLWLFRTIRGRQWRGIRFLLLFLVFLAKLY